MKEIMKIFHDECISADDKIDLLKEMKFFSNNEHGMNIADSLVDKLIEILIKQKKEN